MNNDELYFRGGFSPGWLDEQISPDETPQVTYQPHYKSLETLEAEMEEIKEHLQDVRLRQWNLAQKVKFFHAGIKE